jgi:hypothetical protein
MVPLLNTMAGTVAHIGKPISAMVDRVKAWLEEGKEVRIFTARVHGDTEGKAVYAVQCWLVEHLGVSLPVTNVKDFHMLELWDDRAIQVRSNTGERADRAGSSRPLCYMAHPLGPDGPTREANRAAASAMLAQLQEANPERVFIASWITLSGQWPETDHYRKLGLQGDLDSLEHCQEIWLTGPKISDGMRKELDHAVSLGLRVVDITGAQ